MVASAPCNRKARARAEAVHCYCDARGGAVLAEVRTYAADFLTFAVPQVVVVNPLVDTGGCAFAWIDGDGSTGTVHAVVIDEAVEDGDDLRLAGPHGDDEVREVTLSPLRTREHHIIAARLRANYAAGDPGRELRVVAASAVEDAARFRETRAMRPFAVASVDRLIEGGAGTMATVGALAVDEEGSDWFLATLPGWSHLWAEFDERVRRAMSYDQTPLELLEYLVDHANGITVDYSRIEHVTAPTVQSAAYGFLSRHLADVVPHLVRRRARPSRTPGR